MTSGAGGAGGGNVGTADGRSIEIGAGGGGGGNHGNRVARGNPEPGGHGGGAIHLTADVVRIDGVIRADGGAGGVGNGSNNWNHGSGGGGGAAGGGILVEAAQLLTLEGRLRARGGPGGNGGPGDGNGAHGHHGAGGGGGGGGRIKIFANCREGHGEIDVSGGQPGDGSNHDMAGGNVAGGDGTVHFVGELMPDGCSGPPRIRHGGPYRTREGESVMVSAEGTRDPDEGEMTVAWELDDDGLFDDSEEWSVEILFPDDGTYPICVRVADDQDEMAEECTEIVVTNVPPTIVSEPPTQAEENVEWRYVLEATDPAGEEDPLQAALDDGPVGMRAEGMVLVWTPTPEQALVGRFVVAALVEDDDGGRDRQVFHVDVAWQDEDEDGMSDGWERQYGLDPSDPDDATEDPDGDGMSNIEEFLTGRDPTTFGRPSVPTPESPEPGGEVDRLRPAFTVANAMDPDGDPLTYRFEISSDPEFRRTVAASHDVPEGDQRTSWQLRQVLTEDAQYWWRCRAHDGAQAGDWSEDATFWVNTEELPPDDPEALAPPDGAPVATATPDLVVTTVTDPDRDPVVYHFQVLTAGEEPRVVTEVLDLPAAEGRQTSWTVDPPLEDHMAYVWRARAQDDEGLSSGWTELSAFRVNTDNHPPPDPRPLSPSDRSQIDRTETGLAFAADPDPDGDPVAFEVELDRSEEFADPDRFLAAGEARPDGGVHAVDAPPLADDTEYLWRVRLSDGLLTTDWVVARFLVNRSNDPPGAPTLVSPEMGARVRSTTPELVVRRASDPDLYDVLTYEFEVTEGSDCDTQRVTSEPVAGDETGAFWTPPELETGGRYCWRVRATDPLRASGPWSESWWFSVAAGAEATTTAPTLLFPGHNETVTEARPTFKVRNVELPEGAETITYGFEVADNDTFTPALTGREGVPETPGGVTELTLPDDVELATGRYWWRARATVNGEPGPWSVVASFSRDLRATTPDPDRSGGTGGRSTRSSALCATADPAGRGVPGWLWGLFLRR